jgi:hypothetical protein
MAITLAAATAESGILNAYAVAGAALLNTGTSGHLEIRDAGGTTLLVDILFDVNDPEWAASGPNITLDVTPALTAIAAAGSATAPAVWRLFDGAGTLQYSGTCTGDTITAGDVININSLVFTIEAS